MAIRVLFLWVVAVIVPVMTLGNSIGVSRQTTGNRHLKEVSHDTLRRTRRQASSGAGDSPQYSSRVSYTDFEGLADWDLENITKKTQLFLRTQLSHPQHSQEVQLPFIFPYFGHPVRSVWVTEEGFIYPHHTLPPPCHTAPGCSDLRRLALFGFISPLQGRWVQSPNASITVSTDDDNLFVHIRWHVYAYNPCSRTGDHCDDDNMKAVFGTTLYASGRIVFDYEQLGPRAVYMFSAAYGGHIGLRDSSIVATEDWIYYNGYVHIDLSAAYNSTSIPMSIVFDPKSPHSCATAHNETECQSLPASLNCSWCPASPGFDFDSSREQSFCTDGTGRHHLQVYSRECLAGVNQNQTLSDDITVHHKYYTASSSNTTLRMPDLTSSNVRLTHRRRGHAKHIPYTLPFAFPYYGHPIKHITAISSGFLYMHTLHCQICNLQAVFSTSHIAPLAADWELISNSLGSNILVYEALDKTFVHFAWKKATVRRSFFCLYFNLCSQKHSASFSVTLYKTGRIVFNYQQLSSRSSYTFGKPADDINRIGLRESLIADPPHEQGSGWHFVHYEDVNKGHLYSHDALPKSIVFEPSNTTTCNVITSYTACKAAAAAYSCVWCQVSIDGNGGLPFRSTNFCSDGRGDGLGISSVSVTCLQFQSAPTMATSTATAQHPMATDPAPTTTVVHTTTDAVSTARTSSPTTTSRAVLTNGPTTPSRVRTSAPTTTSRVRTSGPATSRVRTSGPTTTSRPTSTTGSEPGKRIDKSVSSSNKTGLAAGLVVAFILVVVLVGVAWHKRKSLGSAGMPFEFSNFATFTKFENDGSAE